MADQADVLLLRTYLGISTPKEDLLLGLILDGVLGRFDHYCHRPIMFSAGIEEVHDVNNTCVVVMPVTPIAAVNWVAYDTSGVFDVDTYLDAALYRADTSSGLLHLLQGLAGYYPQALKVNYDGGHQVRPYDVERAMLVQSAHEYRRKDQFGTLGLTDGQGGSVKLVGFELLPDVTATLDSYTRIDM